MSTSSTKKESRLPYVVPWNRGNHSHNTRMQMIAAFKDNMLDHMAALDPSSELCSQPLTKITCAIGPMNSSVLDIESLLEVGMTGVTLPMWMFNEVEKITAIRNVREAVNNFSVKTDRVFPLAVGLDLRGCSIHTGRLLEDKPVSVEKDSTFCLTTRVSWMNSGSECKVFIDCPDLPSQLKTGTDIAVDGGNILLNVASIVDEVDIHCTVVKGNRLYNSRPVHVLDKPIALKELTTNDLEDVEFAINMGLDFITVPAVRFECIVRELRRLLDFRRNAMLLLAKIENKVGVTNIEPICKEADAIVLVRNHLAIEMTEERIFLVQDNVTAICKKMGKPMIIEGNLLRQKSCEDEFEDKKDKKSYSRLNVMDVVSSIQKGIDGFIMRDSVLIVYDPTRIIESMIHLCVLAEPSYWHSHFFNKLTTLAPPPIDPTHAISIAVVEAAMKAGAAAILVCTSSGHSAKLLCRYLPRVPVIAVTRYGRVARQLQLYKSAVPFHYIAPAVKDWTKDIDLRFQAGIGFGKMRGFIKPGDALVLLSGWRPGAGFTNTMRMTYASQTDTWVNMKELGFKIDNDKPCPVCPYQQF